ncbi:MAG: Zn-dependent hydrolase [Rhodospirillales bacterium]|jgi:N-carbamoyl-L-amino-acid hydrolase|nr:Zn-dependent hydrolase [Rhodospirillales bacterium]
MPPRINAERLWQRVEALAAITDPALPFTRRSFSALHAEGRVRLRTWFEEAGLAVRLDTAANLIGRRQGTEAGWRPLMIGSHSDTVPNGGRFDGIAGVLTALEVANCLADSGQQLRHPLEVVDFLAEEPSEFGMSCVGSRILGGRLGRDGLALSNAQGETLAEGIRRMGGDPDRLDEAVRGPGSVAAYMELHIEQGPVLENRGIGVGVVTGIVGITRYAIIVEGRADHAGNTPMGMRQDALTAAALLILKVEEEANALDRSSGFFVGTVGQLAVEPNAANVVPGRVRLTVEFRSASDAARRSFIETLQKFARELTAEAGVRVSFERLSDAAPAICSDIVRGAIRDACAANDIDCIDMASGAGHDAMHVANAGPMGMIFIPCRGGRSHCPEEWVEPKDLAGGAAVLLEAVLALDSRLD